MVTGKSIFVLNCRKGIFFFKFLLYLFLAERFVARLASFPTVSSQNKQHSYYYFE